MITKRIPLFGQLEIETKASCNRTCEGCIRNSHPNREVVKPWFDDNARMETATLERLLGEAWNMGFRGTVCLQHYNEPLQDPRIAELGSLVKRTGFSRVFMCTNADLMDEARAAELDGVFDEMLVALYMNEPVKSRREAWLRTLFKSTKLTFTGGTHIATHFSAAFPVEWMANRNIKNPCSEPLRRLIINHRGDMLMCCDDMTGNFDLGNVREKSLEELWFSDRHQDMVLALQKRGGRSVHPHCESCPRP
jgi:radical SAM protein with 4Fe4S-binding SPASM domain